MQDSVQTRTTSRAIPFDTSKLDRLMEEAGLDVLLATSKHNVQYLLDVERAIFFDYMDALGISRYLPVVIYAKGTPDKAGYIGHRLETPRPAENAGTVAVHLRGEAEPVAVGQTPP